jgi:hypothetical protein
MHIFVSGKLTASIKYWLVLWRNKGISTLMRNSSQSRCRKFFLRDVF